MGTLRQGWVWSSGRYCFESRGYDTAVLDRQSLHLAVCSHFAAIAVPSGFPHASEKPDGRFEDCNHVQLQCLRKIVFVISEGLTA